MARFKPIPTQLFVLGQVDELRRASSLSAHVWSHRAFTELLHQMRPITEFHVGALLPQLHYSFYQDPAAPPKISSANLIGLIWSSLLIKHKAGGELWRPFCLAGMFPLLIGNQTVTESNGAKNHGDVPATPLPRCHVKHSLAQRRSQTWRCDWKLWQLGRVVVCNRRGVTCSFSWFGLPNITFTWQHRNNKETKKKQCKITKIKSE